MDIGLRTQTGHYVCAEGGGGAEVVANRLWLREWETFTLELIDGEFRDDARIGLQVHNGWWVCAEGGGGREVNATRRDRHEWETFTIERVTGPLDPIADGAWIALRAFNGMYVCSENGGGGEVNANRVWRGAWESFMVDILRR